MIKLIPGTKEFYASIDGRVFNKNLIERKQYTNGDGYKTASVLTNENKWITFGVHRLVALAHIPYEGNVDELVVNHIDSVITNNCVENLEWLTVGENNIHSVLFKGSDINYKILCKKENNQFTFIKNISSAADLFNCSTLTIWNIIKNKEPINGCYLYFQGCKKRLPKCLHKEKGFSLNKGLRKIKILNYYSKEVLVFDSIGKAAKYFNVKSNHIYNCISQLGKVKVFQKKFIIVDYEKEFPKITKDVVNFILRSLKKEVISYNVNDKKFIIYESAYEFIRSSKLSKKAVTTDLKRNRLRIKDNWVYIYLSRENVIKLKEFINCSELIKE